MNTYVKHRYNFHNPSKLDIFLYRFVQWMESQKPLMKNKLGALVLIGIGALAAFIEDDATALVLFLFFAVPMFFSKKNWFV